MGNSVDHFKKNSLVNSESQVIGVSGPMKLNKRGAFRFPMISKMGMRK